MTRRSWRRYLRVEGSVREDVSDEVAFHLDEQARDLMAAGMAEAEARRLAAAMFGDRDRIEHAVLEIDEAKLRERRRSAMVKDLHLDVRFALRYLSRRPAFAVVAIAVLALGIGATTAVFSIVDAALLRPLPFPAAERVVRLSDEQQNERGLNASWPEAQDWERSLTFLDAFAALGTNAYVLADGGEPTRVIGGLMAGGYEAVLGLAPLIGRGFSAEESASADVVMLSETLWRQRYGGSREVIGRSIRLNDRSYTITGVLPREANVLAVRPDIGLWLPFRAPEWATRGLHFMAVFARLPATMSVADARPRIEAVAQSLRDEGVTDHGIVVESVRDRLVAGSRPLLIVLAGAVVCLLLIVCANLANLFLSHATARRSEFAVRAALGAGRLRLTRQLLTEACMVALIGGIAGGVVGHLSVGIVAATAANAALLVPDGIDARVVLFTALITLLAAGIVGVWPALRAGSHVADTLKDAGARAAGTRGGTRARRTLVGVEVALSVMLLTASGLMVRSFVRLLNEDPGFRTEHVLKFDLSLPGSRYPEDAQLAATFTTLLERIRGLPGVLDAGGVNELPLTGGDVTGGFGIVGREFSPDDMPTARKRVVTSGYFEALGIPVLRGRAFDDTDRAGGREVVIISESFARRYWPDADPIGHRIRFSWGPGDEQEIIGVVGDVRHDGLDVAGDATMYRPLSQFPFPGLSIVVRAERDAAALAEIVRAQVKSLDPLLPIDNVSTLEDVVRASVATRSTLMVMLTGFAALALLLASVGVYAITAFSVAQRTQEIGVRKALGARDGDVLRFIIREEAVALGIGVAAGVGAALAAVPVLAASLHGIEPRDPATLAGAAALLAAIGLLAAWLPARRAARLDPVRALRSG